MPKAYELPLPGEPFDSEIFYLGALCKRGHDWSGGQTLRVTKRKVCVLCDRIDALERQQQQRAANPEAFNAKRAAAQREHRAKHGRQSRSKHGLPYTPIGTLETRKIRAAIRKAGLSPTVHGLVASQQRQHWALCPDDAKVCLNPWKAQASQFAWLTDHAFRLYHRQKSKFYKAQKRGNHCVMLSGQQLLERWAAFNYRCAYCGKRDHPKAELEIEHVVAISNGGAHDMSNIVPACTDCNSSKRVEDALTWYSKQLFFKPERWWRIQQVLNNG